MPLSISIIHALAEKLLLSRPGALLLATRFSRAGGLTRSKALRVDLW
jgi:hypothetical protein